jgi:hypothetical protein
MMFCRKKWDKQLEINENFLKYVEDHLKLHELESEARERHLKYHRETEKVRK